MKNILRVLVFTTITLMLNCNAQNNTPQNGQHIVDNDLNKFVGDWIWTNGSKSFKIILKKEIILLPQGTNITADVIIGFHEFKINGNSIENSTQFINSTLLDNKSTIFGWTRPDFNNIFVGNIFHQSKNKNINFEIEYIDATHFKLKKLKEIEGVFLIAPGQTAKLSGISLPQNIIFTKQ